MARYTLAQLKALRAEGKAVRKIKEVPYYEVPENGRINGYYETDSGAVTDKFAYTRDLYDPELGVLIVTTMVKEYPEEIILKRIRAGLKGLVRLIDDVQGFLDSPLAELVGDLTGADIGSVQAVLSQFTGMNEIQKVKYILEQGHLGQSHEKVIQLLDAYDQARADDVITEEEYAVLGDLLSDLFR